MHATQVSLRLGVLLRILVVSGLLAGYSAWVVEQRHAPANTPRSGDDEVVGITLLSLAEAEQRWRQGDELFLDVRSPADYDVGHVQGALSCPWEEFEERLPALLPRLRRARGVVVYCSSIHCAKSLWAAIRLRQLSVPVAIYPRGWNEWVTAGLPVNRPGP